jgi:hypothetical protein
MLMVVMLGLVPLLIISMAVGGPEQVWSALRAPFVIPPVPPVPPALHNKSELRVKLIILEH